ncbi:MAG TPA: TatD family hydrolase [Solirubrobacterales bacterium]|nr:TatD family hydrolase [Solirubrobacterales bacterium]
MVDTHAHLSVCEPGDDELVVAAEAAGVRRILTVGLDEAHNRAAVEAAERHEAVFASVGRHPNSAGGFGDATAAAIDGLASHPMVRAVGETGLDYYRDGSPREDQRAAFAAQVEIAQRHGLPVVIHVRDPDGSSDAVDEVFATLDEMGTRDVVLHCFSVPGRVRDAAERGWHCSFAGNVTYPRAEELRRAAAEVPDHLILVETDAPFLAPQPVRGKPNQPAHVVATAEVVAAARGASYAETEALVEANAARAFAW